MPLLLEQRLFEKAQRAHDLKTPEHVDIHPTIIAMPPTLQNSAPSSSPIAHITFIPTN
jgi:hypothetical protein